MIPSAPHNHCLLPADQCCLLSLDGLTHNAGKQLPDYFLPLMRHQPVQNGQGILFAPWGATLSESLCLWSQRLPLATHVQLTCCLLSALYDLSRWARDALTMCKTSIEALNPYVHVLQVPQKQG